MLFTTTALLPWSNAGTRPGRYQRNGPNRHRLSANPGLPTDAVTDLSPCTYPGRMRYARWCCASGLTSPALPGAAHSEARRLPRPARTRCILSSQPIAVKGGLHATHKGLGTVGKCLRVRSGPAYNHLGSDGNAVQGGHTWHASSSAARRSTPL